ncbi:MAG: threonine aldolase family protein [Pseudomonadota bacterium]
MTEPTLKANFYSDTQTRPTRAMLETALTAEVGDEQSFRDPTTNALCERVAELLGQEAAVFLPSGTMCNEISLAVHTRPGDEVICERTCHIIGYEGGGPAAISGIMTNPIDGEHGQYTADQLRAVIRPPSRYAPISTVAAVEQTANHGGGAVWPAAQLIEVAEAAKEAGLAAHMDGARLMNAAVAAGVPARDFAAPFDSVWIDFTKGLGCGVGAALAGSRDFIERAWRYKQMWGGAMRQSGILAAQAIYALDHNVDRLADDHALAASLAQRIAQMPGVAGVVTPQTNILLFDLAEERPMAEALAATLLEDGVRVSVFGPRRIRVVTHMDVGEAEGDILIEALGRHVG